MTNPLEGPGRRSWRASRRLVIWSTFACCWAAAVSSSADISGLTCDLRVLGGRALGEFGALRVGLGGWGVGVEDPALAAFGAPLAGEVIDGLLKVVGHDMDAGGLLRSAQAT